MRDSGPNWAEILTGVGTAVIAFGILLAALQLSESRKTRQAAIAIEVTKKWNERSLIRSRSLFREIVEGGTNLRDEYSRLKRENQRNYFLLQLLPTFFEDLAVLEKTHCLSLEWIDETMGGQVMSSWNRWKETVEDLRKPDDADPDPKQPQRDTSDIFSNFEELATKIYRRRLASRRLRRSAVNRRRMAPRRKGFELAASMTQSAWGWFRSINIAITHKRPPPAG
jgi:hypothetical protein